MRLKLDENLGERGRAALEASGHDVSTVRFQGLEGPEDGPLIEICSAEQRCLVTLDLDFSNPLRYPPAGYAGIVVLRVPNRASKAALDQLLATLCGALERERPVGRLWIVEPGRIRIYLDATQSSE